MKQPIYIFIIISLLLVNCDGDRKNSNSQDLNTILSQESLQEELTISEESMNDIIQSLPSPLEIATLIKESGTNFNQNFLNSTGNVDLYTTDAEKALAMGIYTGDLGYINIYEKPHLAISYLGAIKKLADELKIGQFFDIATIKRLASNNNKLDSLLYISTLSYEKMDNYLRDQKRSKISVLLVTGTWIEGLSLATKVYSNTGNVDLKERIADQKIVLNQIILIVSAYNTDEFFERLSKDLKLLKAEYDKVTITYNYLEPETKEVNGRLVIVDNSTTEVNISDEQLAKIGSLVKEIRGNMILNTQ